MRHRVRYHAFRISPYAPGSQIAINQEAMHVFMIKLFAFILKDIIIIAAEGRITMRSLEKIVIAVTFVFVFAVFLPVAKAADSSWTLPGDDRWATMATFDVPVQIGNMVLDPGAYIIQRNPSIYSSRIAMVYSIDRGRWEGIVMGEAMHRSGNDRGAVLYTEKQGAGESEVVRYWFYKGLSNGIEFPVSHARATNIAKKNSKPITTIASSAK
jgi:hypothetical protein